MIDFAGAFVWAGVGTSFLLIILLILTLILAFEIWMLVDLIKNPRIPVEQKVLWAVGMFLVHPLVAIAYYIYSRWYQRS